ncbi:MAG: acyl-CoA dehydrogenase family protein [Myxococcota bacterium]|nr:acyl-CoA dehydrogenase family protein [Myxococcota bacterium]
MDFAFSEEQEALRKSARKYFLDQNHLKKTKDFSSIEKPLFSRDQWQHMAVDLGWLALTLPENYDGLDLGTRELCIILEEAGRTLSPLPLLSHLALGVLALKRLGSPKLQQQWFPKTAAGECLITLALSMKHPHETQWAQLIDKPHGFSVNGALSLILDAPCMDVFLVPVQHRGEKSQSLCLVERNAPGVTIQPQPTLDPTRTYGELILDGVQLSPEAVFHPSPNLRESLKPILNVAKVALAAESLGGAERAMDEAVEYAKTREQFDRPIGSFQAIKHICADMLLRVESARSALWGALWSELNQPDEFALNASLAKVYATESFFQCTADSIQVHGGIGFTWEHAAHFYFKRAELNQRLFGSPSQERENLANLLGY